MCIFSCGFYFICLLSKEERRKRQIDRERNKMDVRIWGRIWEDLQEWKA